jgi:hypothetical protein
MSSSFAPLVQSQDGLARPSHTSNTPGKRHELLTRSLVFSRGEQAVGSQDDMLPREGTSALRTAQSTWPGAKVSVTGAWTSPSVFWGRVNEWHFQALPGAERGAAAGGYVDSRYMRHTMRYALLLPPQVQTIIWTQFVDFAHSSRTLWSFDTDFLRQLCVLFKNRLFFSSDDVVRKLGPGPETRTLRLRQTPWQGAPVQGPFQ